MTVLQLKLDKAYPGCTDPESERFLRERCPAGHDGVIRLPSRSSSLDHKGQNITKVNYRTDYEKKVSRKRYRIWHRMTAGHYRHKGERLRHLTLTSAKEGTDPSVLSKHKQRLIQEIRRLTPWKIYKKGYLKYHDLRKYYNQKPYSEILKFEYLSLRTSEGRGVYHIPYYGDYLPQRWVSDVWNRIHGAPNVWISDYDKARNEGRLTSYLINQYISNQDELLTTRLSWSRGWVFPRFVKVWNYVDAVSDDRCIRDAWWQEICQSGRPPPGYTKQDVLPV